MYTPRPQATPRHGYVPYVMSTEVVLGRRYYVAAYAADPSLSFRATTEAEALRQLAHCLDGLVEPGAGRFPGARTGIRPV